MKFLRTIRFDSSDGRVFPSAAGEDEWAVSGSFAFTNIPPDTITGRSRQAFTNGFLSLQNFGRSTFAVVSGMSETDAGLITEILCNHFVERYNAPSTEAARPPAAEEVHFVADLCANLAPGTVLAVHRHFDSNGSIHEQFRVLERTGTCVHEQAWRIEEE